MGRGVEVKTDPHAEQLQDEAKRHFDAGRAYYVARLEAGGTAAAFVGKKKGQPVDDIAEIVEGIESVGWKLKSSDYVYRPLGSKGTFLGGGEHAEGNIIGFFLFDRQS